jgi:hypothetical protein
MALVGYSMRRIGLVDRGLYVLAGAMLLIPSSLLPGENVTTFVAMGLGAALLGRDYLVSRREPGAPADPQAAVPAAPAPGAQ